MLKRNFMPADVILVERKVQTSKIFTVSLTTIWFLRFNHNEILVNFV